MITNAYFTNIRKHIKAKLDESSDSIYVAVAWFTDRSLFKIICDKANQGLDVQLIVMDDEITRNCSLQYCDLEKAGGRLFMISDMHGTLMHNKFCVIDNEIIITGSYNWSMKASANHENITISQDAAPLAMTFKAEFQRIKEIYHGRDELKPLDFKVVNKRLQVILGLIQLDDYKEVYPHILKLQEYNLTDEILKLVSYLETAEWDKAGTNIQNYLVKSQAVAQFDAIRIDEIKWRIKYFEIEIFSLESEKMNISKIIADFIHVYTVRFGDLISKILTLKKEKLRKLDDDRHIEYEEAERNYKQFEQDFKSEKERDKDYHYLNNEQYEDLKKAYKKAALLCHPDMVSNKYPQDLEVVKNAEEIFKKLGEAYSNNDLETVLGILRNLENGVFDFQEKNSHEYNKLEYLETQLALLIDKHKALIADVIQLKSDNIYLQVLDIYDMEEFYTREEEKLKKELVDLEQSN
ncbi:phospholipase D-like domain-containing protein [Sphingobacterium faecium]